MFVNGPFPDFKSEISSEYTITSADRNSPKKQRKYASRIMILIHYPFCFGIGYSTFNFHSNFIKSLIWFLGYFLLFFLVVTIIHLLLHCLFFPTSTWNKKCYLGFYRKYLTPFCYCKKELKKFRLIIAAISPLFILTIFPLLIIIYNHISMLLLSIAYANALLSAFDLYDIYILLKKIPGSGNIILKSANRYFIVKKRMPNNMNL
ncbi:MULTISPECIES: DUF3267 domain-containing protein [Clostridium]|uniref:DUF3267 domain-containing protein n=1 Tax=Clostridium cibarium TaxID=2762247 RepID=A0ABR8PTS6_9CLOT|nr:MULTISPECIES: DUF3267 domain-containing protein [Clostridium]MBD7911543.1 DUF3267 domain-containing protein [Clostridium cibarium]